MKEPIVVFLLDEQKFGLPIHDVERIVRIVEITPLPKLLPIALGVINIQGRIIPVINLRCRLGLSERELKLSDQLVIITRQVLSVAYWVDNVTDVIELNQKESVDLGNIVPGNEYVKQVLKRPDGLILMLHDFNKIMTKEEIMPIQEVVNHVESKPDI